MIFTNGEKCIVCDKSFTEDDDIVICPHCGTPHHRACYNQLGHCANQSRHSENYEYNEAEPAQTDEQSSAYFYSPDSAANTAVCRKCGAENDKDTAFCSECGERLETSFASTERAAAFNVPFNQFDGSDETIDGKGVSDISAVVGSNSKRFVDKFRKNKKLSWNWGAFIFGGYYFMFRKMYKEGAVIIAVKLAVTLLVRGAYAENIAVFSDLYSSVLSAFSGGDISAVSNELMTQLMASYEKLLPMVLILSAVSIIVAVICGFFADNIYRKKVFSVLDRVETNLENGGSFGVNPMLGGADSALTQEQMRKIYLNKLGGISIFAPILAYVVLDIITNVIIPKL